MSDELGGPVQKAAVNERRAAALWVRAILVIFLVTGLSFGTWLSRLPSLRDEIGASTLQMSVYGLCLAAGSLGGMAVAGPLIERYGARRVMHVAIALQVVMLPLAVALVLGGWLVVGLAMLFVYGVFFSTTDIAMNVSGASAERALGKPRLPLMHAGYSIGVMLAMGLGAAAERMQLPLQLHFLIVLLVIGAVSYFVLRHVPRDERALREAAASASVSPASAPTAASTASSISGAAEVLPEVVDPLVLTGPIPVIEAAETSTDALATLTGSIPIISRQSEQARTEDSARTGEQLSQDPQPAHRYSAWRDPRIVLIGLITLSAGLIEGAPADWLPLALVDGRGVSNEFGAIVLGLFFGSVVTARVAGAALLTRFGRVIVLRASFTLAIVGILTVVLIPSAVGIVVGTLAWGLGTGVCWPVTISAAADNPETAARDVAAVSAVGYTSMLIGPMAFGVLGEYAGLLQAFWLLPVFALLGLLLAGITRQRVASQEIHSKTTETGG